MHSRIITVALLASVQNLTIASRTPNRLRFNVLSYLVHADDPRTGLELEESPEINQLKLIALSTATASLIDFDPS